MMVLWWWWLLEIYVNKFHELLIEIEIVNNKSSMNWLCSVRVACEFNEEIDEKLGKRKKQIVGGS